MESITFLKVWNVLKLSFKTIFCSFKVFVKFCIAFVLGSICLWFGIVIANIKAIIPDLLGIADEINGGTGVLHLIVRVMGWCTIVVPVAIAYALVCLIFNIVSKDSKTIRNSARVVYTTLVLIFFLPGILQGNALDGLDTLDMFVMMGTIVVVCLFFFHLEREDFFFGEPKK